MKHDISKNSKLSAFAAVMATSLFGVVQSQAVVLWQDDNPLSGISAISSGITVTTLDASTITGDATRTAVGEIGLLGTDNFSNINGTDVTLPGSVLGESFSFRVDYFVPTNTTLNNDDQFYLQINFDGVNTASAGFIQGNAAGNGWQSIELTGTVPAGANIVQGQFIVVDGGFGGGPIDGGGGPAVYVDNIILEAVPEPSSLMLAGLGALGLLRRRR